MLQSMYPIRQHDRTRRCSPNEKSNYEGFLGSRSSSRRPTSTTRITPSRGTRMSRSPPTCRRRCSTYHGKTESFMYCVCFHILLRLPSQCWSFLVVCKYKKVHIRPNCGWTSVKNALRELALNPYLHSLVDLLRTLYEKIIPLCSIM